MLTREDVHARIDQAIEEIREGVVGLSLDLHGNPETAFQEHYASRRLKSWLKEEGFEIESPVAGLPTAFVGRAGSGGRPAVAFLMEYDALPEAGTRLRAQPHRRRGARGGHRAQAGAAGGGRFHTRHRDTGRRRGGW